MGGMGVGVGAEIARADALWGWLREISAVRDRATEVQEQRKRTWLQSRRWVGWEEGGEKVMSQKKAETEATGRLWRDLLAEWGKVPEEERRRRCADTRPGGRGVVTPSWAGPMVPVPQEGPMMRVRRLIAALRGHGVRVGVDAGAQTLRRGGTGEARWTRDQGRPAWGEQDMPAWTRMNCFIPFTEAEVAAADLPLQEVSASRPARAAGVDPVAARQAFRMLRREGTWGVSWKRGLRRMEPAWDGDARLGRARGGKRRRMVGQGGGAAKGFSCLQPEREPRYTAAEWEELDHGGRQVLRYQEDETRAPPDVFAEQWRRTTTARGMPEAWKARCSGGEEDCRPGLGLGSDDDWRNTFGLPCVRPHGEPGECECGDLGFGNGKWFRGGESQAWPVVGGEVSPTSPGARPHAVRERWCVMPIKHSFVPAGGAGERGGTPADAQRAPRNDNTPTAGQHKAIKALFERRMGEGLDAADAAAAALRQVAATAEEHET
jgi:hypothetical protein